jgi:hypothetical protein
MTVQLGSEGLDKHAGQACCIAVSRVCRRLGLHGYSSQFI